MKEPAGRLCGIRPAALIVLFFVGVFMFVVFISGVLMVFYAPADRVSDPLITAMIIGPVTTCLGFMGGVLAGTDSKQESQPVTVTNAASDPVPVSTEPP